jgi:hypothetical protein
MPPVPLPGAPDAPPPPKSVGQLQRLVRQYVRQHQLAEKRVRDWISCMAIGGALARTGDGGIGSHFSIRGGIALELRRPGTVRATKDLDLTYHGSQTDMVLALEEALETPFARFRFQRTGAVFEMERAGSLRVEIGVRFDGTEWGTLPLDLTRSESPAETIELVAAFDLQGAFGIEGPTALPCLSLPYHLAHKLHAVTRPDSLEYPNDRAQDLIDLLIFRNELTSPTHRTRLRLACADVFGGRSTHPWPPEFKPPERWTEPFARMANELTLEPANLHEASEEIRQLIADLASGGS